MIKQKIAELFSRTKEAMQDWVGNGVLWRAWEYGVLIQVRDLSRAMRESFSRSQSQSQEDSDLAKAEPRFNFSTNSWAVPASESEYRQGIKYLKAYRKRLSDADDPQAQFYARADNLRYWLAGVESRLGVRA